MRLSSALEKLHLRCCLLFQQPDIYNPQPVTERTVDIKIYIPNDYYKFGQRKVLYWESQPELSGSPPMIASFVKCKSTILLVWQVSLEGFVCVYHWALTVSGTPLSEVPVTETVENTMWTVPYNNLLLIHIYHGDTPDNERNTLAFLLFNKQWNTTSMSTRMLYHYTLKEIKWDSSGSEYRPVANFRERGNERLSYRTGWCSGDTCIREVLG
jgi:hypothetical protein